MNSEQPTHAHGFDAGTWPFDGPDDAPAFCCRHVAEDDHPVLRVTHDEDGGTWQFLCGGLHDGEDARVVCLGCIVTIDATLLGIADLPLGWCAERETPASAWRREPNMLSSDDDAHDATPRSQA